AVGQDLRLPGCGVDIELVPVGSASGCVSVDVEHLAGDEMPALGCASRPLAGFEPGKYLPQHFGFLPDRVPAGYRPARPVEHAVFGERADVRIEVAPVHREQVSALQILDLRPIACVVVVVVLGTSSACHCNGCGRDQHSLNVSHLVPFLACAMRVVYESSRRRAASCEKTAQILLRFEKVVASRTISMIAIRNASKLLENMSGM